MLRSGMLFLLLLGTWACSDSTEPVDRPDLEQTPHEPVMTTFYPLSYFAERIAVDRIPVECPVPADADPIFWQPPREALQQYQEASLILVNGADFEKWLEGASLPQSRVVDTAKRFEEDFITFESTTHRHGSGGEHTHEGIDGHTWLDPILAKQQAEAIEDAFVKTFTEHGPEIRRNADTLYADLERLHLRLEDASESIRPVKLLASHPAYNYIARRYEWNIENFDLDPEAAVSGEQLEALKAAVPESGPAVLLWESEPLPETAAKILQAVGVKSIVFSPCEMLTGERIEAGETYLTVMSGNIDRLLSAIESL